MDTAKLTNAYTAFRNGANFFVRHPLVRQFQYSDGVQEVADAGCHWLLDIIATECLKPLRNSGSYLGVVHVTVADDAATIELSVNDEDPPVWTRFIDHTDLPLGRLTFFLADEGERFALILPSEY
jgi:hypothetical protein